jgi:outer membrane protein OmpA-like peptidoglycan-associated protein
MKKLLYLFFVMGVFKANAQSNSKKTSKDSIKVAVDIPVLIKENLGSNVNSTASEIAPIISPDGRTIYFTRYNHPNNQKNIDDFDVWYSHYENDVWQPAINIGKPVNNQDINSITYISPDERSMLLMNQYLPDGTVAQGLSESRRNGQAWTFPQIVNIKNYTNEVPVSAFTMSPNGKIMVLTLQNKDTKGSTDLYISYKQADSSWSEPRNMGNDLNTPQGEGTPFISADTKTLYFTSEGRAGFGGYDIYLSRRLDDTWLRWSEPLNLGKNVNTADNDAHFTIPASGAYAYLCSENAAGNFDIFRLKLPTAFQPEPATILTGKVLDKKTKQPIAADIVFESLDTKEQTDYITYDPASGQFKLVLPISKVYGISAIKQGYQAFSDTIDLRKEKAYREIQKDVWMTPLAVGEKIILNNVFFAQSEATILSSSYPELNRVNQLMLENPTIEVLLEGHTDNQGDFNSNLMLSQERVAAVKKYLADKGISAQRIQIKGWGSTRPIYNNLNPETRKYNRRVEFTVMKK